MIGRSAAPRANSSPIEGVVVLGMHRSGTSVVTRLVSLMGLALCHPDDLLAGFPGNPRGHWESKSLVAFDSRLLGELDGTWFCPPALGPEAIAARLAPHRGRALALLNAAHPRRPFVWKDPRACLLLPFWSSVLERRAVHILVARHPMEVTESLKHRNGFSTAHGLALWERYSRLALIGSADRPVVLCTYDEVLSEPVAWSLRLAAFLGKLGVDVPGVDEQAISAFVTGDLRRGQRSWEELGPAELFPPQRAALALATADVGTNVAYQPPELAEEAPATEAAFAEIRRASAGRSPAEARMAVVAERLVGRDDPRPPASLVIGSGLPLSTASVKALAGVLPAGSEVLAPRAERRAETFSEDGLLWRQLPAPAQPGYARPGGSETLAGALDSAGGRTVVLCTAPLPTDGSWYQSLQASLSRSKAGCVGAAIRLQDDPSGRLRSGAFDDRDLQLALVPTRASRGLARSPLLFAGLCAFDGRVLSAAGGLDPEFDSASAALAELSLRLWRMGFASFVLGGLEIAAQRTEIHGAASLYDRMRIAALHLDGASLRDFDGRARRHPDHDTARARLDESQLRSRRALTDAVCAFSADRYFDEFPPHPGTIASRGRRAATATERSVRRIRLIVAANGPRRGLELAGDALRVRLRRSRPAG